MTHFFTFIHSAYFFVYHSVHTLIRATRRTVHTTLFRARGTEEFLRPLTSLPSSAPHVITHTPYTIHSLGRYDTPLWHALIYEVKFHRNRHAVSLIAPHLAHALRAHASTHAGVTCMVVPIPLHSSRERARGYNQVALVAEAALLHMSADSPCPHACDSPIYAPHLLKRTIHRKEQKTLNRTLREENVSGSFCVPAAHSRTVAGAHIVLLDDVCATGATVREAARTLTSAGAASVTILVFCNS